MQLSHLALIVRANRRLLQTKAKGPKMGEQCKMDPSLAIAWQAALILEGRRKVLTYSQTKLDKATEYVNRGLTMATATEAEPYMFKGYNACAGSTPSCVFACVGCNCGQGRLPSSKIARIGRTVAENVDLERFLQLYDYEVEAERLRSEAVDGKRLALRCNVSRDDARFAGESAKRHPLVEHYDYTAIPSSARLVDNVQRVYSRKDGARRSELATKMLAEGFGVAVVFAASARRKDPLPDTWQGAPVIDGDVNDLWFTRAPKIGPYVVGLRVKGNLAQQVACVASGFAAPV